MNKKLYAIVLTFDKSTNDKLIKVWGILKQNYKIKYICSRSPIPHLTLISGRLKKKIDINKIKKKKFKKFNLRPLGLGIFANDLPLIYLRWEKNKNIYKLYKSLEKITSKNFLKDKNYSAYLRWIPKTSLAFKDLKYKDLPKILKKINFINSLKNVKVEYIKILQVDKSGEKIYSSLKLI